MAKKDNSPAISFFSFQDIITSITGIMFLVVMMLVLLVVSRSLSPSADEKKVDQNVAVLQQRLADLKAQLSACAANRDDLQHRVTELKQLDLASLEAKKEALIRQMEIFFRRIAQEKRSRAELEKLIAVARAEEEKLQTEQTALEQEKNDVEKLLKESAAEKEMLIKKMEHSKKLVRFVWRGNTTRKPLVAVCSREKISIQDGLSGKPLFSAKGQGQTLVGQFLEWCRNQDATQYYIVLVAKPSSFHYADDLSDQLNKLGFERGKETLPTDDLDVLEDH